jgi:hypothetical protein
MLLQFRYGGENNPSAIADQDWTAPIAFIPINIQNKIAHIQVFIPPIQ